MQQTQAGHIGPEAANKTKMKIKLQILSRLVRVTHTHIYIYIYTNIGDELFIYIPR